MAATLTHSGNRNNWSHSALCWSAQSASRLGCVCPCALLSFQTRAVILGSVAVETRVALLNQLQYEHAHSRGNPVKAGSVWQTGMLNRGWMGRLRATRASTHTDRPFQAWGSSFLRLGNIRPPTCETDVEKKKAQKTDKSISQTKENCCIINKVTQQFSLPLQLCTKNIDIPPPTSKVAFYIYVCTYSYNICSKDFEAI